VILAMFLRFFALLAAEFFVYFVMYRSKYGKAAVYRNQHAWVIDVLAIFSGSCVAAGALYALLHPGLFATPIHPLIFWGFFVLGSSQAMMHVIKWGIRFFYDS
jgi:hypothetical protein